MESLHPIVALVREEHKYSRPWYRKINGPKYPHRLTRFLYLRNFPRHFLSKYPNAFQNVYGGNIDIGSYEAPANHITQEIEEDQPEDEPLDTSLWTQQKNRLYSKTIQILQQHHLTKLVHENLQNGPVRMVNLMENTILELRYSFANIAGWDNDLLLWLHNLITTTPHHEYLMPIYHEAMQYLSKRLPSLTKFYAIPPSSVSHQQQNIISNVVPLEEDPSAKFVLENNRSTPRRLTSNPLIMLVPSGPNIPSQPLSARMEYWKILLSAMGQLVNVNIPYRAEQNAQEILQLIKTSVREKIRDIRKKKFNELRPLILVGFNQGSLIAIHCALENPGQVSSIICLGFPLTSINGFRGDLDDPMLEMNIPILFVVGQMASTTTLSALERLRESMTRSDTGLVVVGGANDKLLACYKKKMSDGITQYHVDKSIADEIYDFINSISMPQPTSDTY